MFGLPFLPHLSRQLHTKFMKWIFSRHVILSAGDKFSNTMWQIVTDGLEAALEVTTYSLRQLMTLFKANSENFYGDIGQVKVATRKDCSPVEFVRMWHLAQQVGWCSGVNMSHVARKPVLRVSDRV